MRKVDCACATTHAPTMNRELSASFTIFMGSLRSLTRALRCALKATLVYTNTCAAGYVPRLREGGNQPLERGRRRVVNMQARLVLQFGPTMAGGRMPGGISDQLG